jgi:hypothetical protein
MPPYGAAEVRAWYHAWLYRKAITIDADQVPSDQTYIPIWVDLSTDDDVRTKAKADASDVLFTQSDGKTKLSHELITSRPFVSDSGAWCWFADPRAVYYNGKTYVGWVNVSGDVQIAEYNHSTEEWSEPFTLHAALQYDDHANPTILIRDSDKRVMVFYCRHNAANLYMRVSTNAEDVTAFGAEADLDGDLGGINYCYPTPVQLTGEANDPIYLFYRENVSRWYYSVSTDGGATWAAQTALWDSIAYNTQIYLKIVSSGGNRIDFVASDTHPDSNPCSLYHFYYTGGNWYQTDGTLIVGGPVLQEADVTLVYDGSVISGWQWDIAMDGSNPVIAYATFPTPASDHRYNLARWNGAVWASEEICTAGGPLYVAQTHYSGGLSLDHADINTVYVSREVSGQHEIQKYTYSGGAWSLAETITSSSPWPSFRPFCPRNSSADLPLLWVWGYYPTFNSYITSIVTEQTRLGTFRFVVNVPALDSDEDTTLYVYYGNASASAQADAATCWADAGYEAVYHGNYGANGNDTVDDSANGQAGTGTNGPGEVAGRLFRCLQFPDTSYVASTLNTAGWSEITVEVWALYDSSGTDEHPLVANWKSNTGAFMLRLEPTNDTVEAYIICQPNTQIGGNYGDTVVPVNTWAWFVMRYDTAHGIEVAIDDVWSAVTYGAGSGNFDSDTPDVLRLGSAPNTLDYLIGKLEEVRISSGRKSDDWLTTIYNNQNDPASFYSIGAEQSLV